MCIVLDANCFSDYVHGKEDMIPVKKWVEKKGKILYSPYPKIAKEYTKDIKDLLGIYSDRGRIKSISTERLQDLEIEIKKSFDVKSNDLHILALAKAGKGKLLVSKDKKLHEDFNRVIEQGSIYQNKTHEHLIRNFKCPD